MLGPQWHLTYGQSAIILYSGGIGAICGAVIWGALADAWGRKPQLVLGTFICGIGAGAIGFVPDGAWGMFAILRFVVGFGLTAAVTPCLTIVVETAPTPHPHRRLQLLRGVRHRRHAAGISDLGDIAVGAGLARRGHAGRADRAGRHRDRVLWCRNRCAGSPPRGASPRPARRWHSQLGLPLEQVPLPSVPPVARRAAGLPNCTAVRAGSGRR